MGITGVIKARIKDIMLSFWLPYIYKKAACQQVDKNKVIFVELKEAELPDSFRLLYQKLSADDRYCVEFVSLHQNSVSYPRYCKNCTEMLKKAAVAKVIFLNDASDVLSCVQLRSSTRIVQLWHACGAFKKWGMSTADLLFGGTREQLLKHPFYKNLSLVTVSSPEVVWAYEEAMVLQDRREIIKPTGVSRTDVFFDKEFLFAARRHVHEVVPESMNKKIILYAPTFRGRVNCAQGPDQLDIAKFKEALSSNYTLLIKHHPFVKIRPEIPAVCQGFAFDVSESLPIDELLCIADVCISDYSSLVFEYSIFERPIVFFAYDKNEYEDWRGFYYDYNELTPGPVFSDNASLIDYIMHIDERFDTSKIAAFRKKFMGACDGHATDRILNAVFDEEA